jgi:acyl-coenzyme A synthetase/AMP-(fatty) acid ligase
MIFRFASLMQPSVKTSLAKGRIERYCQKVTIVWCAFFVFNGSTALFTVFFASDAFWSIYNGGISYILMGILFCGELIVRKMTDNKMPKAFPLSGFTAWSRPPETVLCYNGSWQDGDYKTWQDFLEDTASLRRVIEGNGSAKWLLYAADYWYFLTGFTALLQCRKEILLSANVSPAYLAEIRDGGTAFLSDQDFPQERGVLHIPSLLEVPRAYVPPDSPLPPVNADETAIVMYTSGTTGKPKAVFQRLTEFETDNRFILSKWGEEFLKRKLCSTVSPHHIYGLLFSVLLPFTAGVPFRRRRIEYPEEFEKLHDDSYLIVTVPAFLKRAVEGAPLPLRSPWIFTSGGVLSPEIAAKTDRIFGFWPVEVYGSTETSGIAYRQSRNGPEWTPFDDAEISKNDEDCLVVRSPYIKNPTGFVTGDLVDIRADGRFILKGRADSIVKIEEKRISLPEVENRILQSGLVADVCVLAMEDRRQYLAAALVLNERGKERFGADEKIEINRYFSEYLLQFFEHVVLPKKWRYLDALPLDTQGKKKKLEIEALFASYTENPADDGPENCG